MGATLKAFRMAIAAAAIVAGMSSCAKDTEVADPYANWEERNVEFIDSIAQVAAGSPENGEIWRKYLDYRIEFENDLNGMAYTPKVEDYVYVKYKNVEDILTDADKDEEGGYPISFNDTVYAAYQGFLINGTRFNGNYYGTFDKEVNDNFNKFTVNRVVPGWTIALLNAKPQTKDIMEVYIPSQLGYGEQEDNVIPKNSALKFEVYVDEVIKPKLKE